MDARTMDGAIQTSHEVGRPGLDPGTLGLKVGSQTSTTCHAFQTTSSRWVTCLGSWTEFGRFR